MSKWGDAILKLAQKNPDVQVIDSNAPRTVQTWTPKPGANTVEVATKRRGKYNARRVTLDSGQKFDSAAEARTYAELQIRQERGEISDLELQPRFELIPAFTDSNGEKTRSATYTADFRFIDDKGRTVVVDVKGGKATQTQAFNLRWKMLRYLHRDSKIKFELWER